MNTSTAPGGAGGATAQEVVSRVVRVYMAARDETQEELGLALGVSRPAITQKLSGRSKWTLADLDGLARHYGVDIPELLSGRILERLGARVPSSSSSKPRAARRTA
jgi:peptidyl-prolyl cis-trans isomerase A (cyclophilin A)